MSPRLIAAGLLFALAAQAPAQKPFDDPVLERMRKDVFFLAGPECEGRGIDTKGIEKAADHVAAAFKAAGLKPGGKDGSYFQPFKVTASAKLGQPTSFALTGPGAPKELELGTDYNPMGYSPTSKAAGGVVFAGYGITAPALKYDDYDGLDAAGKVVVVLRKTPRAGVTGEKRFDTGVEKPDESAFASFQAKIENAAAHRAAALIVVNDTGSAGAKDPIPQFENHARGTEPAPFPVLFAKREVVDNLLAGGPWKALKALEAAIDADLKPRSFEVTGVKAEVRVTTDKTEYACKNVVGVLDGAGPLAGETVVVGAHYDHIGYGGRESLGAKDDQGKIHYGADDNASGTAGLMELARRYGAAKGRQGRRLVFVAFSAEEKGLFGSLHYCKEPPFPLDATAAMINMDMIGRVRPEPADWLGVWDRKDRLLVYGTGTAPGFDGLADAAGRKADFRVTKLAAGTGPSDHDSFYRKKVPVLYLYTGTHGEYHRPTDVPEKVNVPGMAKVVGFVQVLVDDLSARDRPTYQATRDPWSDPTDPRPARPSGPRLGIRPGNYEDPDGGVLVEGVSPGGAAEKGGVKDGDVIVEIGGRPVKNIGGYMTAMGGQKAGAPVEVVVLRKGEKLTLKLTPE